MPLDERKSKIFQFVLLSNIHNNLKIAYKPTHYRLEKPLSVPSRYSNHKLADTIEINIDPSY